MRYYLRRLAFFLLTLWAALTLNFIIPRLMPGDPAQTMVARLAGQSQSLNPATVHAVRLMLGMSSGNVFSQYWDYLKHVATGNFGVSYIYFPYSVIHMIGQALPWTLVLVGMTQILSFIFGTISGALAAWKRNGPLDSILTLSFTFTGTMPFFWVGLVLVYIFAFRLGWFPVNGGYSGSVHPSWTFAFIGSAAYHSVLPAIALLITTPIGWIMGMRNNMIQILGADYTRLAVAKGLPSREIALTYGARNAILPNLTAFAIALGSVVGGVILVEIVFGYPGMGKLLYDSVTNQDYPLMQTIFLLITIGVLVANLIADFMYGWLDPRVRRGGAS